MRFSACVDRRFEERPLLERRQAERVDALEDDPEVNQVATSPIGARAGLYVPLLVGSRPIGVIVAHDKEGDDPRFSDDDLRLAEIFAARAAVAVDLSARVARDALRRVVEAQELERRRLARELHDQTGQELTSVLLGLKAVEEARGDAEHAEAWRLFANRCSPRCTTCDAWLSNCGRKRSTTSDSCRRSNASGTPSPSRRACASRLESRIRERLPADVEAALYRIVQEALTNTVKHAQASTISIVLGRTTTPVTAVIEDDGRGFTRDDGSEGLGLLGMGERLALLGGKLTVESSPGSGTSIVAAVPLP